MRRTYSQIWTHMIINNICHSRITEAEWRIFASVNIVIIGWDKYLSPVQHQAIIGTCAELVSIWSLGMNFSEIWIQVQ